MESKDSYWFRHDSTAGRALKMRKMSYIYSHWGKGIYWDVVEILRDQKGYIFECDESSLKLLSDLIGCKDENKFLSWFSDCERIGLFDVNNGVFNSPALTNSMVKWDSSKVNGSKGGRPKKKPIDKPKNNPTNNPTNNPIKTITEQNSTVHDNTGYKKILNSDKLFCFEDWLNYRQEIKKPIKTESTMKSLVNRFNKEPLDKCISVVRNSIENNYQGLFWDNYKLAANKNDNKPQRPTF